MNMPMSMIMATSGMSMIMATSGMSTIMATSGMSMIMATSGMSISYPILLEIYDFLLMSNKKKLIKSYNEEYIDVILKEDLKKRYKLWITQNKPTLNIYNYYYREESKIIEMIDTFEELCQPQQITNFNVTALIIACTTISDSNIAIKLIDTFGELCLPQQIDDDGNTALMNACSYYSNSDHSEAACTKVAFKLINTFGKLCLPQQNNKYGNTALIRACDSKLESVVIKLIDTYGHLCNPHKINIHDDNALLTLCEHKLESTAVKLICAFGKDRQFNSMITRNMLYAKKYNLLKVIDCLKKLN